MIYRVHKEDTIRMHEYNFGITGGIKLLQKFYEGCGNILKEMDGVCVRGTIAAFVKTNDGCVEWVM